MRRPAVPADLPRLLAIRDGAGSDALSDPALLAEADLRRLVASGAVTLWDAGGRVVGYAAIADGAIHLLVDASDRDKGIGRELLAAACAALKQAGYAFASVTLPPASGAERHYRAAGWRDAGRAARDGATLTKPL